MRRRILLAVAAVVVPLASAAFIESCSTGEAFESVCLWVADPANCFREFRKDFEATMKDCQPLGSPTQAIPSGANGVANGAFTNNPPGGPFDVCFINGGGTVKFDPPIDLTMLPGADPLAPTTEYKLTFVLPNGSECGHATYASPHGF